jgi:hypothetical protein
MEKIKLKEHTIIWSFGYGQYPMWYCITHECLYEKCLKPKSTEMTRKRAE